MTTPLFVQSAFNSAVGTSLTVTLPGAVTGGNSILAFASSSSTTTTLSVADNINTGNYAADGFGAASGQTLTIRRFTQSLGTSPGVLQVTLTASVSSGLKLTVWEVANLDTVIPLDQATALAVGNNTTPTAPATNALGEVGEFVVTFANLVSSAQTWTPGAGFTLDPNFPGASFHNVEYQVYAGTAAITGSFTITGSSQSWAAITAAYRSFNNRSLIVITTTGASTFVPPSDWPGFADKVEVIGGGGAGRSAAASTHEGLGGGGGAYTYISPLVLSNGDSLSIGPGGTTSGAGGGNTWVKSTSTLFAAQGGGALAGVPGAGGLVSACIPIANANGGASGGAFANSATAGGTGGGGAGGPFGNGAAGGAQSATGVTGGTGGGGGGGNSLPGTAQTASNQAGTAGGVGADAAGMAAGTGGAGGASGANAGSGGTQSGTSSGGGGGGGGSDGAGGGGAGGNGGFGNEWSPFFGGIAGSGGGGGGAGEITSGSTPAPGNGGLYGGGGGGGGQSPYSGFGMGAQGVIVITYTPLPIANTAIGRRFAIGPGKFNLPPRTADNAVHAFTLPSGFTYLPGPGPGVGPNTRTQFVTTPRSTTVPTVTIPIAGLSISVSLLYSPLGLSILGEGFIPSGGPGVQPFNNNQFLMPPVSTTNPSPTPTLMQGLLVSDSLAYGGAFGTGIGAGLSISYSVLYGLPIAISPGATMTGLAVSHSLAYATGSGSGVLNGLAVSISLVQSISSGQVIQPLIPMLATTDVRLRIGYQPWKPNKDDVIG